MKRNTRQKIVFSIKIFIWSLILYNNCSLVYSQTEELKFEHLTTADGLANYGATAIFQDSKGFLWIGSTIGINRYDGYSYTFYEHLPIRTNSTIIEDKQGFIWTIVEGGVLYKFDRNADKFKAYPFSKKVRRIFEAKTGDIWISTEGDGLARYIHSADSVIVYKHKSNDSATIRDNVVNIVFEDQEGNL